MPSSLLKVRRPLPLTAQARSARIRFGIKFIRGATWGPSVSNVSSLFKKMLFAVGAATLVPYGILIFVSIEFAYRTVSDDAYRYAEALSEHYASDIASLFNSLAGEGKSLAAAFSAYDTIPPGNRRTVIDAELRAVLERQPDVEAAWAQWERGAIGDNPRAYVHSLLTTESGAFNATWYRKDGGIAQGWISDEQYNGDFYTLPKARRRITLIDPYLYSYSGRKADEILETSLCFPIESGGVFKGVLGFDFALTLFQRMASSPHPFVTGYGILVTGTGSVVSHPLAERLGKPFGEGELSKVERAGFLERLDSRKNFSFDKRASATGEDSRFYFSPIQVDGIDTPWYFALVAPKSRILAPARTLAFVLVGLGTLGLLVVAASIFLISRSLARPITALAEGARRIAAGELSFRVSSEGRGEVGTLASSFNDMAEKLETTLAGLEARVAERTASLAEANSGLEKALSELKVAEEGLELSAKMALLGRLTANISHELNSPIGAIRSSASLVLDSASAFFDELLPLYAALSDPDRALFLELAHRGEGKARRGYEPEDRARKMDLARRLEADGIEKARSLADDIALLGAFDLEAEIRACARRGGLKVISAAGRAAAAFRSLSIILEAAEKAAGAVSALANYSRGESLDLLELVRPAEDIEAVLTLYYSRLKRTVTVERSYACDDPIRGYRERLKEVWMNLIDNALQAMDYRGKLAVSTYREGKWVLISVADTGPGIPEAIRDKVFTPFFTTKAPGEGTGLGLNICKRIVEKHGGELSFSSGPGGSTFYVRLPACDGGSTAGAP
jgi:signal transduction histidine kinase